MLTLARSLPSVARSVAVSVDLPLLNVNQCRATISGTPSRGGQDVAAAVAPLRVFCIEHSGNRLQDVFAQIYW